MPRTLTYYFTLQSPWSYLGHAEAMALVRCHHLEVIWKTMNLAAVFPASGGLPLAKRHPARQAYRDIELHRWRSHRGITLNLRPAFWPISSGLADRTVVALVQSGADPDDFVRRAWAGIWAEDENLDDEGTIARMLSNVGADPNLVAAAGQPEVTELYDVNSRDALAAGVFGAPTYILDGEPFWGQDRLSLLDEALTSGRAPFPGAP